MQKVILVGAVVGVSRSISAPEGLNVLFEPLMGLFKHSGAVEAIAINVAVIRRSFEYFMILKLIDFFKFLL